MKTYYLIEIDGSSQYVTAYCPDPDEAHVDVLAECQAASKTAAEEYFAEELHLYAVCGCGDQKCAGRQYCAGRY